MSLQPCPRIFVVVTPGLAVKRIAAVNCEYPPGESMSMPNRSAESPRWCPPSTLRPFRQATRTTPPASRS